MRFAERLLPYLFSYLFSAATTQNSYSTSRSTCPGLRVLIYQSTPALRFEGCSMKRQTSYCSIKHPTFLDGGQEFLLIKRCLSRSYLLLFLPSLLIFVEILLYPVDSNRGSLCCLMAALLKMLAIFSPWMPSRGASTTVASDLEPTVLLSRSQATKYAYKFNTPVLSPV